jgi:hypothetical protein
MWQRSRNDCGKTEEMGFDDAAVVLLHLLKSLSESTVIHGGQRVKKNFLGLNLNLLPLPLLLLIHACQR